MEKKLYSISAIYHTPNDIVRAAKAVKEAGYTKFDVHTPYPIHGLDGAMGLKETKLGFVTLAAGILGAVGMISFASWVAVKDYPQVIGGKPYWSWPAFVPVTYEIAVLLAVLGTVGGMIAFFFKFPNTSHPLHDTSYMKKVSSDKFGVTIQADDAQFDEKKALELLTSTGGEVESIYYTEEFLTFKPNTFDPKFILLLVGISLATSAGGYLYWNKVLYLPPFDWMVEQPRFDVQSATDYYEDGRTMRLPVEGTIARGFMPYPYALGAKTDSVGTLLVNPLVSTKAVLDLGKRKYLTYCSPCHGNFAKGDSRLNGQFPNPPTLHSDKVRNWPDGAIFHTITVGQNVMPGYQYQLSREERWAVVKYIRTLQRAYNAKESDLQ